VSLLSVEEGLRRILAHVPAPQAETVPLAQANNRVLLTPVTANRNQPPFASSSMDGYAVCSDEVVIGRSIRVIGTSQAGQGFAGRIQPGTAVRIFTGAPLPNGADAVIIQENSERDGDLVRFTARVSPGINVRPVGNDFKSGQVLLERGMRLGAGQLLVAAAANVAELSVSRRARIAILATGDELVPPGTEPGPDQIISSNTFGIAALLSPYAETITDIGIAADQPEALVAKLEPQLAGQSDIVVISGGASVGDRDYLRSVLLDLGVELDFWTLAMRPGKPLMFGTRAGTLVFGLPGNPVSAMVTAEVFLKPALRKWLGFAPSQEAQLRLPLSATLPPNGPRKHYLRGTIYAAEGFSVSPCGGTDSAQTALFARADALIIQPENDPGMSPGTLVDVLVLNSF